MKSTFKIETVKSFKRTCYSPGYFEWAAGS